MVEEVTAYRSKKGSIFETYEEAVAEDLHEKVIELYNNMHPSLRGGLNVKEVVRIIARNPEEFTTDIQSMVERRGKVRKDTPGSLTTRTQ